MFEADELSLCAQQGFEIAVHEPAQVRMLEAARLEPPLTAWLKVDSGMNRLGFRPEEALAALGRLRACASLAPGIRLMTHFSSADEPGEPVTQAQIDRFAATTQSLDLERSFCNSAGVLAWPEAHAEWIRPGVSWVSVGDGGTRTAAGHDLTKLIAVRQVPAGEAVGYAGTWQRLPTAASASPPWAMATATRAMPVRHAGAGRRQAGHVAGRVSMDMLAIDLTGHPEAQVGSPVTLREGLPVETIASHAGTIAYEALRHHRSRAYPGPGHSRRH